MSSETKYISDIPHLLEEWNNKRNESLSPMT